MSRLSEMRHFHLESIDFNLSPDFRRWDSSGAENNGIYTVEGKKGMD